MQNNNTSGNPKQDLQILQIRLTQKSAKSKKQYNRKDKYWKKDLEN